MGVLIFCKVDLQKVHAKVKKSLDLSKMVVDLKNYRLNQDPGEIFDGTHFFLFVRDIKTKITATFLKSR